ncbi:MAG: hypothetical protein QW706_08460 [Candidatus Nezhaarchaeales archaeon]
MRKKVVALVILVMVLISLAPLAVLYIASRYRYQTKPDPLIERIRESARSKIAVLSPREFEVVRPLTWAESTLTMGADAFYYVSQEFEARIDDYDYFVEEMYYFINVLNIRNCTLLEYYLDTYFQGAVRYLNPNDPLDRIKRESLLRNDCEKLYRMFSHEESWFASLGALGYASRKYLEMNNVTHWKQIEEKLFMLAHVEVGEEGVRRIWIKFYNISNEYEAEEMERDASSILLKYPKIFFVYLDPSDIFNLDIFNEVVSDGAQMVVFNGIVPYRLNYRRTIMSYFLKFASLVVGEDQIAEIKNELSSLGGAIYIVNGKIVRVY